MSVTGVVKRTVKDREHVTAAAVAAGVGVRAGAGASNRSESRSVKLRANTRLVRSALMTCFLCSSATPEALPPSPPPTTLQLSPYPPSLPPSLLPHRFSSVTSASYIFSTVDLHLFNSPSRRDCQASLPAPPLPWPPTHTHTHTLRLTSNRCHLKQCPPAPPRLLLLFLLILLTLLP